MAEMIQQKNEVVNRQSGDIDAWKDGERDKIIEYVNKVSPTNDVSYLHVRYDVFHDTEVEIHFTPSVCSSKKTNKRMQDWFEQRKNSCFSNRVTLASGLEIVAPTAEFNLVFLLHHIYRHYLYEGIGLRQIMDYYFVLRTSFENHNENNSEILEILNLTRFAGALMYVMQEVFGLDEKHLLCPVDEKRGRRLLEVIIEGCNFGHSTEKYKITG